MYFDCDKRKIYYYINNEYVNFSEGFPDLYSFTLLCKGSSKVVSCIDNIAVFKFDSDLRGELKSLGMNMPLEFMSDIECQINSKYVNEGNIFFDFSEAEFSADCTNTAKETISFKTDFYVTDFRDDVIWKAQEETFTLEPGAKLSIPIKPDIKKYDKYVLHTRIVPDGFEGALPYNELKFSVANGPTPGKQSPVIGTASHLSKKTDWRRAAHGITRAGFGYIRTEFSFDTYNSSGLKGIVDNPKIDIKAIRASGIEPIAISYLPFFGMTWKELANSPEKLAEVERIAENMARDLKGIIDIFELGNEVNGKRLEDHNQPEHYAIICQSAYRGLKKGNPDCIVLSQGVARVDEDWMYRYLMTPGGESCDAIAIHPYHGMASPETKYWVEYMQIARDIMDKAGKEDMEIWITEIGTSYHRGRSTEQQMAINHVRTFAQVWAGAADKCLYHEYQSYGTSLTDQEHYFGIVDGCDTPQAYAAKQPYLAVANFNAMTEDCEFVDKIERDNVYVFRFKKADGSHMIMMYADRDVKNISLDLGAMSGTWYDINGNAEDLVSQSGKYTFNISDQPQYFRYTGEKFSECESLVGSDMGVLELTKNDTREFNLTIPEGAIVELEHKDNSTVELIQNGSEAKIKVTVNELPEIVEIPGYGATPKVEYTERRHDFGTQVYRDFVYVTVKQNGNTIGYFPLAIDYVYVQADITMNAYPYDNSNTEFWKAHITVKNNNQNKAISGDINVKAKNIYTPSVLQGIGKTIRVENLQPGEEKEYSFNIPRELSREYVTYYGEFSLDDGEVQKFALGDVARGYLHAQPGYTRLRGLEKAEVTPVIDGVLNEDEWKNYKIINFDKSQVSYGSQGTIVDGVIEQETFGSDADYGGMSDFSGTIYSSWDENYLYVGAIVHDDVHYQNQMPVKVYIEDSITVTLVPTKTQRHDTRIDVGLTNYFEHEVYEEDYHDTHIYKNWSQVFDTYYNGPMRQGEGLSQAKAIRKGNTTYYEVRLKWNEILDKKTIEEDRQFNLNFTVRDYDGDRDKTWSSDWWFVLTDTKN